jgi:hypothetical protein
MLDRDDLHHYQHRAVEFIKSHDNCALWVGMGLGKSVTTLTAFSDLLAAFDVRRMLVIAPLRVARKVWLDEIHTWAHLKHLSLSVIGGTEKQRVAAMRTPSDIHTINRENTQWLEAQFLTNGKQIMRWPWDLVVLDESQSFKSQSSKRWKSMRRLRRLFPRMVQLTGTPSPNGYGDLWSQLYLLDRGERLGITEKAFTERWFDLEGYGQFKTPVLKRGAEPEIQRAVADIVLSLREEDYLDLPEVIETFVRVTLPESAMRTYREMAKKYTAEVAGTPLTAVNAGVLDGKLLQLANGAVYIDGEEWVEFHTEKLDALEELIEGISGKMLVAYHYRHDLERIQTVLRKGVRPWSILRSDKSFVEWASGNYEIGVLHPASAGHGLNDVYKAGAEDVIHFGLNPSLELYQQVNARLTGGHRRAGKNIRIHHIVADGTRDDHYVGLLQSKAATQDGLQQGLTSTA